MCIVDLRNKFESKNKTIISPFEYRRINPCESSLFQKQEIIKNFLELSKKNIAYFKIEKLKKIQIVDPERHCKKNNGSNEEGFET